MDSRQAAAIRIDHALIALLLAAAGFSVWLAHQNRGLRAELVETRLDMGRAQVGDWLPAMEFPVLNDEDEVAILGASPGKRQLLYFFSPGCGYCRESVPYVEKIYEGIIESKDIEMYAVSTEGARATELYLAETGSAIPTVVLPGRREISLYRVNAVPMLVFLEEDGRVRHARYGVLSNKDVSIPTDLDPSRID